MSAVLDSDLENFRLEARKWLEANFPPSLKGANALSFFEGFGSSEPDYLKWKKAMGEKGWGVPTWPKQYGGGGLTKAEARVLTRSEEHTSELQSRRDLVCRLLLEKKK